MKRCLVFALLGCSAALAQGETRYISDQLEVTLRKGQSTRYEIVRMLPSGTPVELLEADKDTGYSLVRTASGAQGWVLTRYLMAQPSARERLASAEQKLAEAQAAVHALEQQIATLTQEKGQMEQAVGRLEGENRDLAQQSAEIRRAAANVLAIDGENKSLKGRILALERDLQSLQQENDTLKDRTARDWFVVGAGVLLSGLLLGLVLPKIHWRKRSRWDTL